MNKPIILVIYGMGPRAPGDFKNDIAEGLNEATKNFGLRDFDISDEVDFF